MKSEKTNLQQQLLGKHSMFSHPALQRRIAELELQVGNDDAGN